MTSGRKVRRSLRLSTDTPVGTADLTPLALLPDAVTSLTQKMETADAWFAGKPGEITCRFLDEEQTAGHRGYILASGHIAGATEHVDALFDLFESGRLTPRAPYSLIRPIFEHAFWACWLLDPEHGLERRRRGLRMEVIDWKARGNWLTSLRPPPEKLRALLGDHEKIGDIFRKEALKLGLKWNRVTSKPDLTSEIPNLGFVKAFKIDVSPFVISTWRLLSGLAHGQNHALLALSDRTLERELERGGAAVFSVNDDHLNNLVRLSCGMLFDAMDRFTWLTRNPPQANYSHAHDVRLR